jgi:hypothetical protein
LDLIPTPFDPTNLKGVHAGGELRADRDRGCVAADGPIPLGKFQELPDDVVSDDLLGVQLEEVLFRLQLNEVRLFDV